MKPAHKRLSLLCFSFCCLAGAVWLLSIVFKQNILYFKTPHQLTTTDIGHTVRIGGLVLKNSYTKQGLFHYFKVTDGQASLAVIYQGILPTLFREGQGIVADGLYQDNKLIAQRILAKHDENYMPKEVATALKKQGLWHEQ
jgi:cytochrome c-type biogenesis protein CcmE